ncbi:MAG: alpha/beta hydrolase [Bacteroidota bacterium]
MYSAISSSQWKSKGNYFTRKNGRSIFYLDEGKGPTILFLHGFPTSSWDWSWVWQNFEGYRRVALDFIGYGYSDKPKDYDYSIFDQVDIVEELLSSLDVKQIYLVAHDFGDSIAQELIHRSNNNLMNVEIQKTILLNGGLFMKYSSPRPIQKILLSPIGFLISKFLSFNRFKKSFSEVFALEHKPSSEELKQFWDIITYKNGHRIAHKLIQYINERYAFDDRWTKALSETKIPLKLIIGTQDPVSGEPIANRFREVSENSEIVLLNHIGHYPQTEDPLRITEEISSFFLD